MNESVSFWDRRRAAVKSEAAQEARAADAETHARTVAEIDAMNDADALEALGLPDPETLGPGDDFSAFMRGAVPDRLRRIALRRLWRSNPVLACVDGLNDYDDDFRKQAVGQVVKTAYQVGKGMIAHTEYLESAQRKAEAAASLPPGAEDSAPVPENTQDAEALAQKQEVAVEPASDLREQAAAVASGQNDTVPQPQADPAPRRMRFNFEGARA